MACKAADDEQLNDDENEDEEDVVGGEEMICEDGVIDDKLEEVPDDLKWMDAYLHEFDGPPSQVGYLSRV